MQGTEPRLGGLGGAYIKHIDTRQENIPKNIWDEFETDQKEFSKNLKKPKGFPDYDSSARAVADNTSAKAVADNTSARSVLGAMLQEMEVNTETIGVNLDTSL